MWLTRVLCCAVLCSLFMGNIELPGGSTGSKQTIKMPVGTYEFGANLISEKGVSENNLQAHQRN